MTELDRRCRRIRWENRLLFWVPVGAYLLLLAVKATAAPIDLAAIVQARCGPPGYHSSPPSGCTIKLGRGVFEVGTTVLGTCENPMTQRLGVTIEGMGTSPFGYTPRINTGGTTLVYAGPPGGTWFSICGSRVYFRDLAMECNGAGTCIQWKANNEHSAVTHFGGLERVAINRGDTQVQIVGETWNDQIDFMTFRDLELREGKTCIDHDSQQAVLNVFDNIDCASSLRGAVIRNGGVTLRNFYAGQWGQDPAYIGLYLTKTAGTPSYMVRQPVYLDGGHFEVYARHIVDDSQSSYPLSVQNVNFLMMPGEGLPMERVILDSKTNAPVTWIGNTITSNGDGTTARICHRGGPLHQLGSQHTPWTKGVIWGCP